MNIHTEQTSAQQAQGATRTPLLAINVSMKAWIKPIGFILLSSPFIWLVYALLTNQLGANPIEEITEFTGEMALRILLLSLAMTPLRMLLKRPWPIQLRRMIGLFSFFYVLTHFLTYLLLDQQLDGAAIIADIIDRPYITAGSVAFIIMIALALTSTNGMARRMGKRWKSLHQFVYIATGAAILHFVWLTRGDQLEPLVYLLVYCVLMLFRAKKLVKQFGPKRKLAG